MSKLILQVLVTLGLVWHASVAAGPALSDRDAARFVQKYFDDVSAVQIPTGSVTVVRDGFPWDTFKGRISYSVYHYVRAAADLRILNVQVEKDFVNQRGGNWNDFHQLSQQGMQLILRISDTDQSRDKVHPQHPSVRSIPSARFTRVEVVSNEEKKAAVEEFRLVRVRYEADWLPIAQLRARYANERLESKRHGALLLKWNAFESRWKVHADVYGNASQELDLSPLAQSLHR